MKAGMKIKGSAMRMVPAGIMLLLILLCGVCNARAQEGNPDPVNAGEIIFEGWAGPAKNATETDMKVAAVADAERNALIEAVRPMIHPALLEQERKLLTRALMERRGDILEGERMVFSGVTETGGQKVVMAARIREDQAEDAILKNLPPRMVIFASASLDGKASKGYITGEALSSAARTKGYKTVDLTNLNDERSKGLIAAFRSGDRGAIRPLCIYLLAKVIVEGRTATRFSERTGEIYSSRAEGSVKLTKAGGETSAFSVHEVKGFGSNEPKASLDAAKNASFALASKTTKSLPGRRKKK